MLKIINHILVWNKELLSFKVLSNVCVHYIIYNAMF